MSSCHNLPPEIIEAILRCLPAKSLGRFKSVSKPWCSLISNPLISNPQFIKTHLDLNNNNQKLILVSGEQSLYSLDINAIVPYLNSKDISMAGTELCFQPPFVRWIGILGSCNGLVLALEDDFTIYLMNPTTLEILELPISPFSLPSGKCFELNGFGYDSSTDDYKVVWISSDFAKECTDMFINVYSLRNNSWRNFHTSPYNLAISRGTSGVLINGSLHWLITKGTISPSTIIAFSLANELFTEMELPESVIKNCAVSSELVVIGGKLGFSGDQMCNDIWVMEEYGIGESWTKVSIHGVKLDPVRVVCSVDDSNRDVVLGVKDGIVIYNVDESIRRKVRMIGCPTRFTIGGTYLESLISPKSIRRTP